MGDIEPLVFSQPLVALAVLLIVWFGSVIQAGLGMGFGLSAAPVLALLDPALVPAAALYLGMTTACVGAFSEKGSIVWREVTIGMAGRASGIGIGLLMLVFLITDRSLFQLTFGVIIAVAVAFTAMGWVLALNTRNLLSMGFVSGFMGVVTSVGAPPLALIYQSQNPERARPTLSTFFAIGGFLSLAGLYSTGIAGLDDLWMALFMAPAALLGTTMGRKWRNRFSKTYKPLLLALSGTAAILLIIKGTWGLLV